MTSGDRAPASQRCASTGWSRGAGLALAAMAGGLWLRHLRGSAVLDYDEVLVGSAAVLALLAALKMVRDNCFESRLAATVLATLTALGELLAATIGGPAGSRPGWQAGGLAVTVVATLVPVLVACDARARARSTTERHPYAL